jgi:hypothetical protein
MQAAIELINDVALNDFVKIMSDCIHWHAPAKTSNRHTNSFNKRRCSNDIADKLGAQSLQTA